ncbi:conserved Plasmodium protein, unknown function [Plasmodium knowlesi strain H]|uniref:Uncharacterized protein n=3 Tax=Plasmodium knowlesi TaxID=5850 RepID=A0A5K1VIC2_PLAKH|nr:conserved Plasmodium protein, unknown function [Plasmodium knowlesi strain H]OTN65707.1 Uncharacterized protein PKNOH_S110087900 [Plasmodium knowlesi]CAA9989500.1 conserved Plasmodium protein, unknown function [Plasmodium knowlesi strain H]SBO25180.1 conserved Plasmodium protein, unknown function [Plasmodium knowlesi strain H]SBO27772.1 conserved Plasmodium protein, unknown function [Plasmodium knowlesi strain H]VVS78974.1 conserved Plasmodium protein, unknown function [Plasmodium knowlesi |eukprot:XP_002260225.1 hypothetical protein, conserved in Plasmodium species [Plasmodium knowlesi strain H]
MRIANVQRCGRTYVELVIARLCRGKGATEEYNLSTSLRKNGKRNYCIARHQQSASRGKEKEEGTSCAEHERDIKDTALQSVNISLSEKTKQQTKLYSRNDVCEQVTEKRIRESLKKYNLFNVYLEKIKKASLENRKKKQKITNINSVKHYDQYVHMFDIDSLLIYANNKFKIYKKKREFSGKKDFFAHFVKIFIQLNVILNNFFSHHGEINCGEYFKKAFKTYLQNIPSAKCLTINKNKYDQTFLFKILQLVKIFNQIKFFKTLKGEGILHLEHIFPFTPEKGKGSIRKEESNYFPNVDHHKLFYEYMTSNYYEDNNDKEKFDSPNDNNFVKNLNLFGDKLEEITDVDDAESFFFHKKRHIRKVSEHSEGDENMNSPTHCINEDLRNFPTSNISSFNYPHVCVNAPHNEIIGTNKLTLPSDEEVHDELKNYKNFDYAIFSKAFIHLLKILIKHLHDDGVVRLFILCSNMFDTEWDDKEVLSFYTEMYKRIYMMKNISNKNIAYILSACNNYSLKKENTLLLKKLNREILSNSKCGNAGTKSYLNIYNVTPSHLENIIYTFAKHRIREKNMFTLLSEIVKEKFHGFSCITTINILNSYAILNYESLVFDFLYAKIRSFDFLTFMMCKAKNVIKLMNTLLLIESRNYRSLDGAEKVASAIGKDDNTKRTASLTDEGVYIALMSAMLYELKTFKGRGTHSNNINEGRGGGDRDNQRDRSSNGGQRTCARAGEEAIVNIYKKLLRLKIIGVQKKSDMAFLKSILKKTYGNLDVDLLDDFFVFSFINLNLRKINFHKLVFTLLTYNNLIEGEKLLNNYTYTKTKFI